ncbi:zinc-dependent alcohol dehydrogenase family protein [Flavobacterium sp. YZ-48]|uniref:enoyl-[acyl-carrier-protein] reductase n=2 Tax=Flavobacterium sedimenticola TaxID=3043286 RepID=A0ABT6XTN2_9FLAO|nr:zinc-dependent alcohol dehydrogenase family protein [Flavobacterium sedimenticola]
MNALQFSETGTPDTVLQLTKISIPEPGPNEIRIKVRASPINPADLLFIQGTYRQKPVFPQTAGLEGTGIIDKVGPGVARAKGQLVAFRHKGAWAEYVILPLDKIIELPGDFPLEKACQMALNPITAYALLKETKLKRNDWLVVTAGNSAIAQIIVQLAQLKKINTILVVRSWSQNDDEYLKKLGAKAVLESNSKDLADRIVKLTNAEGINSIVDAVGGDITNILLNTLKPGGMMITYGLLSNEKVSFHNSEIIFKNITIKGFGVDYWLNTLTTKELLKMHSFLTTTIGKPNFIMPAVKKYNAKKIQSALQDYKTHRNGKIVLTQFQ